MRLQVGQAFRIRKGRICCSGIAKQSTKIALGILILESQQASNQLKLDLGSPLTLHSMMLPVVNHKCSWVKSVSTTKTPLSKQACDARCLPKFFKLACQKHINQFSMQRQMINGLQLADYQIMHKLRGDKNIIGARQKHHGNLSKHHTNMSLALLVRARITLTSVGCKHCLNQKSYKFLRGSPKRSMGLLQMSS